jgi:hypothetical protein
MACFKSLRSNVGNVTTIFVSHTEMAAQVGIRDKILRVSMPFDKGRNSMIISSLKGHPKGYQLGTGSKDTTRSSELMEEGSVRSEQGNFKVYHPVPRLFCGGLGA